MFSLIVSTLGRTSELDRFLASLHQQAGVAFEVLLVDQNDDDRLDPILHRYASLPIRHLRSPRGLSVGRNVGLACATGDLIAIPDDDCWYPDSLLACVAEWFNLHLEYGALSTIKLAADLTPVGPNWPKCACEVDRSGLWQCAISSTIFMRRALTNKVGRFNEDVGIGAQTRYQSGEETDYLLRALEQGFRIWYEPSLVVHHPNLHSLPRIQANTYSFALGSGYVMGVHRFSLWYLGDRLVRSLGGAAVSLLHGDTAMAGVYLKRFTGQLRGYLAGRTA